MKRSNIVKALTVCQTTGCHGCPYDGECSDRSFALDNDIISILTPLPPTMKEDDPYCPDCHTALFRGCKFCHECGREIKW